MKSKHTPIRIFGQRSIAPSVLLRSSNPRKDPKDVQNKESKKESSASLSDFLDRKLNRSSVLPKPTTVQEKSRPFTSLVGPRDIDGSTGGQIGINKGREEEKNGVLDKVVFEQFKQSNMEKVDSVGLSSATEEATANIDEVQESRKRKDPFEGVNGKDTTRKPILVLGDHPKPKQKERAESYSSRKKPRPPYNHYSNGCGWWDSDMEGVDSEEVGFGEVWEGVGSTTYGGIVDWH